MEMLRFLGGEFLLLIAGPFLKPASICREFAAASFVEAAAAAAADATGCGLGLRRAVFCLLQETQSKAESECCEPK